jgi:hypothetical protein
VVAIVHFLFRSPLFGNKACILTIESSKFNIGKEKIYLGVPGNLIAFACKVSVERCYQGFVAFDAKSALIKHYQDALYATHFRGLRMFIDNKVATRLILQYFKS